MRSGPLFIGFPLQFYETVVTCFILGVLIPGFLLFLFIKFTKIGRNLKNSFRFKFIITALILYFSIVYFIPPLLQVQF